MKTQFFLVLSALLLMLGLPGMAQQATGQDKREQLQQRLDEIKERLALTPEQVDQIRPVLVDELQQMKAVRDQYGDSPNRRTRLKMAREVRGIQSATDDKLKTFLSKMQMDELKKIREEMREEFRQRRNG